jgi:hypothetical protein
VWIEAAGTLLSALVHDNRAFALGEAVAFEIDAARCSLFDVDREQRL